MDEVKGRGTFVSVTFDFVKRVSGRDQIFHLNSDIFLYCQFYMHFKVKLALLGCTKINDPVSHSELLEITHREFKFPFNS